MERLIKRIEPKINKYTSLNNMNITLFELETTMAILYFYENDCDFVILETGLGGMYDCTNIVNPIVSIITSVGYDHMHILGNSLTEIAEQKAGIIKENSETVFVKHDEKEVNDKIKQICIYKNNILHLITKEDILNYSYNKNFQKFDYKEYKDILINLKGEKQIYNASICIECTSILRNKLYEIPEESLRDGLKTVIHKARFETVNNNPLVIYDGAHNKPAIENLINSIDMYYRNEEKVYIIKVRLIITLAKEAKNESAKFLLSNNFMLIKPFEEKIIHVTSKNSEEFYVEAWNKK